MNDARHFQNDMTNEVFISYRQENDAHRGRVYAFARRLRQRGIRVVLDQFYLEENPAGPDWVKWSEDQATNARRILIIGTKSWFDCYKGDCSPGKGLGAAYEAKIIRQRFYSSGNNEEGNDFARVVYLDRSHSEDVPLALKSLHHFDAAEAKDFDAIVTWLGGRPRDTSHLVDSEKSPWCSEMTYQFRLFRLALRMCADRRRDAGCGPLPLWVDVLALYSKGVVPLGVVVLSVAGVMAVRTWHWDVALVIGSAVTVALLAVLAHLFWFCVRHGAIEQLLLFAATSPVNFLQMMNLRKEAQEQHFKFIVVTLHRIYRECAVGLDGEELELVRLAGEEGGGEALAAMRFKGVREAVELDFSFETDPVVFARKPGVIASDAVFRSLAPYDIRDKTGKWNAIVDTHRQAGKPVPTLESEIFEKDAGSQPTPSWFSGVRLKPGNRSGLNYCLSGVALEDRQLRLEVQTAEYGTIMDSCDSLIDEALLFGFLAHDLDLSAESALKKLPWRRRFLEAADRDLKKMLCAPTRRAAGLGISCFTSFTSLARDDRDDLESLATALRGECPLNEDEVMVIRALNTRRSDRIGTYPDMLHVVPAGMFGCFQDSGNYEQGDLTRLLVKEMFEEVFNVKEAQDYLGYDRANFDAAAKAFFLGASVPSNDRPKVVFTGLCFDLLNLRPELCFHWHMPSPLWDRTFVRARRAPLQAKTMNRHERLRDLIDDYEKLVRLCMEEGIAVGKNSEARRLSEIVRVEFNYESARAASYPLNDDAFASPQIEHWVQSGLACAILGMSSFKHDNDS